MKKIVLKIIKEHINKRIAESEKQIHVLEGLLKEAKGCNNEEYEKDLTLVLEYHNYIKKVAIDLLFIF